MWYLNPTLPMLKAYDFQGVSCEGACVHAHVRCAVARVCVQKGFKNVHAMCVCATVFRVCEVRSQFRAFLGKKGPI